MSRSPVRWQSDDHHVHELKASIAGLHAYLLGPDVAAMVPLTITDPFVLSEMQAILEERVRALGHRGPPPYVADPGPSTLQQALEREWRKTLSQRRAERKRQQQEERRQHLTLVLWLRTLVVSLGGTLPDGRDVLGRLVVDGEVLD